MKFIPRQNFVVLQMDEPIEQSKPGFALRAAERADRMVATVLTVGPGHANDDGKLLKVEDLQIGDRVLFNKDTSLELSEDERLYLLKDSDIACKIND